jgi:putative transposase
VMPDHVHMLISIPPKYSVAEVTGYLKGKSSIWIAQNVERELRNFLGHKFWARGYFVSTVGRNEETMSLLRTCCGQPRRGATEKRDKIPAPHSITSSANHLRYGLIEFSEHDRELLTLGVVRRVGVDRRRQ